MARIRIQNLIRVWPKYETLISNVITNQTWLMDKISKRFGSDTVQERCANGGPLTVWRGRDVEC